jgi:uncharacterized membrane protein
LRKKLPDSFETEDLLEDLEIHILEAFSEKQMKHPSRDKGELLQEVLDNLGTPEEIAQEFGEAKIAEQDSQERPFHGRGLLIRLLAAVIVVIITSWIVSIITAGAVDFWMAVIVLMVFVLAEWTIRAWQMGEYQRLDTEIKEKQY